MRLEGKVALITGGGTGLGAAAAEAFVAEGAKVCITGRRAEVLASFAAKFPADKLKAVTGDVSKEEDIKRVVAEAVAFGGKLNVVVNNAAAEGLGGVLDVDLAEWQKALDTNLTGPFLVCRHTIPHLIAAGGGSIINVASIAGILGLPAMPAYCTTKAGLLGLTRQLAYDFGVKKIRANAILPGAFRTDMLEGNLKKLAASLGVTLDDIFKVWGGPAPLKRVARPEELKGLFLYLASDESTYTTGAEFICDAGLHNIDAAAYTLRAYIERTTGQHKD